MDVLGKFGQSVLKKFPRTSITRNAHAKHEPIPQGALRSVKDWACFVFCGGRFEFLIRPPECEILNRNHEGLGLEGIGKFTNSRRIRSLNYGG